MKSNKRAGFTLIELLVVVAIIGILAAVVLAALNSARSKGSDAGIKSNLDSARTQGEVLYNTRVVNINSYTNVCMSGIVTGETTAQGAGAEILTAAKLAALSSVGHNNVPAANGTRASCNDSASAWAAEVPLSGSTVGTPKMWCVDSNGKSKQESVSIGAATVCS